MNLKDIQAVIDGIAPAVREYVAGLFSPIESRIEALESRQTEKGEPGKDGRNAFEVAVSLGYEGSVHDWLQSLEGKAGKSVTIDDIRPIIANAVKEIPIPKDGKDGKSVTLEDIQPLISEAVGKLPPPKDGKSVTAEEIITLVTPLLESKASEIARQAVAELPKPKDGEDGKSVTLDDVRPIVQQAVDAIPRPKDGTSVTVNDVRPIIDEFLSSIPKPKDGQSVSVDEINKLVKEAVGYLVTPAVDSLEQQAEANFAKWQLEFERRATDLMQRWIDRIPKPKDGEHGKDGLGFDDMRVEHDGERGFTLIFERGEQRKEFSFTLPVVLERGVYKSDRTYERGDAVTADGSYWIAQKDAPSGKPGQSPDWRLAVKKGRDGKGS